MNYKKAVRLYFAKSPQSAGVLKKMIAWDEGKTLSENMRLTGIAPHTQAYRFAKRFGLKYTGGWMRKNEPQAQRIKFYKVDKLRDMGYTLQEIGRLHGVTRQRIEQISRRQRKSWLAGKIRP